MWLLYTHLVGDLLGIYYGLLSLLIFQCYLISIAIAHLYSSHTVVQLYVTHWTYMYYLRCYSQSIRREQEAIYCNTSRDIRTSCYPQNHINIYTSSFKEQLSISSSFNNGTHISTHINPFNITYPPHSRVQPTGSSQMYQISRSWCKAPSYCTGNGRVALYIAEEGGYWGGEMAEEVV